ncbi:MAG: FHA domain-containing protein [Chloroflexi bacterium]|nr:FHA domain-containing protein [Chloroflexota bacterium]
MQLCANCGHQNRAGVVFCENCGASLIGKLPLDTKSLEASSQAEKEKMGISASVLTDVKVQGVTVFREGDTLRLDIEGSPDPIAFKPKPETIFGRRDPATGAMPDVDLTPFAGYRMGVSRRHAAIRFNDESGLDLWDLGSSNGTFLNGQRLSAHRPYRLHDGDELRLGQMMVRVYFEIAPKTAEISPATAADEPAKEPVSPVEAASSEAKVDPAAAAQVPAAPSEAKPEAAPSLAPAAEPAEIKSAEVSESVGTMVMHRNKVNGLPANLPPVPASPETAALPDSDVAQASAPAPAEAAPAQPVNTPEKPEEQEKRD